MFTDDPALIASNLPNVVDLRFREGAIRGKLQGDGEAPIPRHVVILLDGVEVATVEVRGRNLHEGPFTWFAPARLYDDASHVFEVRLASEQPGGGAVLGALERQMMVKHAPVLHGAAFCGSTGRIEGFAWNSVHPTDILVLEIWERGECQHTFECNLPTPLTAPEETPPTCGFSFVPEDLAGWASGKSRIIVPKFGEIIAVDFASALDDVAIDSVDVTEDLVVMLRRPPVLASCTVSVEIDGEPREARVRELAGFLQVFVGRPLSDDDDLHRLTVDLNYGSDVLTRSSAEFRWTPPHGLLDNAHFLGWSGDRLEDWTMGEGLAARPGVGGDGIVAPATSIVIEARRPGGPGPLIDQPLLLSQQIVLGDADDAGLEVELISRGPAGRLVAGLGDATGPLGQAVLDGGSEWKSRREFVTFDRPPQGPVTVTLRALADLPERLELAYFNAGPKGFVRRNGVMPAAAPPGQAIANGAFRDWSRGLQFATTAASQETADGWTMFGARGLAGIQAGLAQVVGADGKSVYGLCLSGTIAAGPIRVATQINPAVVMKRGDWRVGLTLQQRPRAGGMSKSISRINRLVVTNDPTSLTAPAATIGYNIHVDDHPETHSFLIREADWTHTGLSPQRSVHDQQPVFLVFEFNNHNLDCIFSDAFMEPAPRETAAVGAYSAFEDFNLLSQLERIEGVEAWRSGSATDAFSVSASPGPAAPEGDIAWKSSPHPLVDIVIPVYNAEEHTLGCLNAIVQVTDIPYRLIVVDDGSAPSTARALDDFAAGRPWVQVIHNDENKGYTITANTGLKAGRSPWVVLLNSDTIVTPGWLQGLMTVGAMDEAIAMVGPLSNAATWQSVPAVRDQHGQWAINQLPPAYTLADWAALVRETSRHAYPDVPLLNGFCTLMRRSALEAVGYLDEEVFPIGYGEEVDLCLRISKAGYRMLIADDVYIYHHKSSSFGKERRAVLAKQGGIAVRKKHRDVNLALLEQDLATLAPVLDVRQKLSELLEGAA